MDYNTKLALIVCLLFTIFWLGFSSFLFLGFVTPNNSSDFAFHWEGINGVSHEGYPDGFHSIFYFFRFNKELFFGLNVFLICFVLPLLLFRLVRTWWVTLIYFSLSLPSMWLVNATFPQVLVFLLLVVYLLNRRNWLVWLLCGLLSVSIHREGVFIFGIVLFAEFVEILFDKFKDKKFFSSVSVLQGSRFSWVALPTILLIHLPLPILYLGKNIVKDSFFLVLGLVGLLGMSYDFRTINLTQLALIIIASQGMRDSKHKKFFAYILLIQIVYVLVIYSMELVKMIILN